MVQNCPWYMLDAEPDGSDQVRGASIIDVDSIGEGGGSTKSRSLYQVTSNK